MTIHCFDVIYSPNASMDSYLSSWLTSWSAWEPEPHSEPSPMQFSNIETGETVDAAGFRQNRFQWDDTGREPQADAEYIVSQLTGQVGYLASYCDWWIVRWHQCYHEEDKGCDSWVVIDSSNNYSGQSDVPSEVPQ